MVDKCAKILVRAMQYYAMSPLPAKSVKPKITHKQTMKLACYTPASCSTTAQERTGLDALFRTPWGGFSLLSPWLEPSTSSRHVATDVQEDEANYEVSLDLPGVKKEDIKLDLTDRTLSVSAERKVKSEGQEQSYSLRRSFTLPRNVAGDSITAKLEDGVLTLRLPKTEQARPRSIEVN
jgi:HSP20 family protein